MSLEPIDPETALELYLMDKEAELAESSIQSHRYRLKHFLRWCEMEDIDNLNDLTGRKLQQYRLWRRDDGDLSVSSEKTQMDTLRVFIRWAESIDAVEQDLSTKVRSPSMTPEQNTRDEMLETEEAEAVLSYLAKYDYASREHVTVALMWHTMMRVSSVNALDVDDYNPGEQYIEVHHRPETDTPIKNKKDGERLVALSDDICMLLDDWIEEKRPNVTDDFGREPLVATRRAARTRLRFGSTSTRRPDRASVGQNAPKIGTQKSVRLLSTTRKRSGVPRTSTPTPFVGVASHTRSTVTFPTTSSAIART
ncbi:tyrosine-type recombinase/integrase [Natrinema sp. SYSU A 869]|uniref:tyrosine-type recombinase/integrase n=1 Tax=Natrinema sp. SYSU A 869 TaxID=2871694 RepID=UPI0031F2DE7E